MEFPDENMALLVAEVADANRAQKLVNVAGRPNAASEMNWGQFDNRSPVPRWLMP